MNKDFVAWALFTIILVFGYSYYQDHKNDGGVVVNPTPVIVYVTPQAIVQPVVQTVVIPEYVTQDVPTLIPTLVPTVFVPTPLPTMTSEGQKGSRTMPAGSIP